MALVGCSSDNQQLPVNISRLPAFITVSDKNELVVYDGEMNTVIGSTWPQQVDNKIKSGETVELDVLENNGRIKVGCYRVMIRWEKHWLGSCIKRNAWHLQLHIRDTCRQKDVFNAGMVGWWERGPQFGIFEERSGFCAQSRGTWTEMRNTVLRALGVVGITGAAAYAIANFAASTAVVAFAF